MDCPALLYLAAYGDVLVVTALRSWYYSTALYFTGLSSGGFV